MWGERSPHQNKMKNLPYIWLESLSTFDIALEQVELCLTVMKENAETANFYNPADKKQFQDNLAYMKQIFETAELLARGR